MDAFPFNTFPFASNNLYWDYKIIVLAVDTLTGLFDGIPSPDQIGPVAGGHVQVIAGAGRVECRFDAPAAKWGTNEFPLQISTSAGQFPNGLWLPSLQDMMNLRLLLRSGSATVSFGSRRTRNTMRPEGI